FQSAEFFEQEGAEGAEGNAVDLPLLSLRASVPILRVFRASEDPGKRLPTLGNLAFAVNAGYKHRKRCGDYALHTQAPHVDRVPHEMDRFMHEFETRLDRDPFLHAGVLRLYFLTIHPFEDGNERIARALTDLLLSRADGVDLRFYSMSAQIERERETYYDQQDPAKRQ
ncbi:MAG: Fic family protein, partial [Verrucomicrobia bacterium]|nr:Fic family protein [Verrucomicrobiota bacterium]